MGNSVCFGACLPKNDGSGSPSGKFSPIRSPLRTVAAAAATTAPVSRFRVPSWSPGPCTCQECRSPAEGSRGSSSNGTTTVSGSLTSLTLPDVPSMTRGHLIGWQRRRPADPGAGEKPYCGVTSANMTVVTELDLPEIHYNQPDCGPQTYHQQLAEARKRGWLAHSPLAYIVLDPESGDFFLRARQTAFPGRQIAELFGITGGPLHAHIDANILNLTGDTHRPLRSLVGHAFTPRAADRRPPVMRRFLRPISAHPPP